MKPSLCLNMIVRSEAGRILRCLKSVAPYIKSYSILDTGSTDDTCDLIRHFFNSEGIKGHIHYGSFHNFSQARNEAFVHARDDNGQDGAEWCQFALLMDADMEFRVENPHELMMLDANALSYDMMQKAGPVSYANRRLLNLSCGNPDPYVGVTHEYLNVAAAGMIKGASFVDHADGANRDNKALRDIALLEDALQATPDDGRYVYYLANSYRDAGMLDKAIEAYNKRISMGGWAEETHSAMMGLAFCEKDSLNFSGFVDAMLQAYNFRPERAEPLYELAKVYRERNQQRTGLVFAKAGLKHKRPDDLLFVNDFVYDHGLRYEYSILGYYDEAERGGAFEVTDALALDPTCPAENRESARRNLFWHLKPLSTYCPSYSSQALEFTPPPGYTAMNPSVEECNGVILCNVRCVNYKINEHGQYMIGPQSCHDAPIDTRNFIVTLGYDLSPKNDPIEIVWHRPPAQFPMVTGLEDIRLYRCQGRLCFVACIREQASTGLPQQVRGKISFSLDKNDMQLRAMVHDWAIMSEETACEKNWMPIGDAHNFVYRLDTIIHKGNGGPLDDGMRPPTRVATTRPSKLDVGQISGGSQAIPFKGGYMAVVHEASVNPGTNQRTYWHRFAWFNLDMELRRLSVPFVFEGTQIEFCCGLAYHPNHKDLILSFGVRDAEARLALVATEEVARMCWKFHEG